MNDINDSYFLKSPLLKMLLVSERNERDYESVFP